MLFDINVFSQYVRLILNGFIIGLVVFILGLWLFGYLGKLLKYQFKFESDDEVLKFSILGICFTLIIGVYWMLRTFKDPIFYQLVGREYVMRAKIITPFAMFIVLYLFNMLVDRVKRHKLFYIACFGYALIFVVCGLWWKFQIPEINHYLVNWIPGRALAWIIYIATETLGGLLVGGVFWAFVASTTKTVFAKRGYPLIFLGGQIGNFFGPAFNAAYVPLLGTNNMVFITAGVLCLIPFVIEFYMKVVPAHMHESDEHGAVKKKKTGAWEGLRLIATKPFIAGIAIVSTIYEVVGTITDYQFKVISSLTYSGDQFVAWQCFYAMSSAVVAMIFAAGGTSFLIRWLGVRACLLIYPISLGVTLTLLWFNPSLWMFFIGMIVVKAFSYALNNPVKELIYLPTSKDVKMKAKGFIDGLGGKSAKAIGAGVGDRLAHNLPMLLNVGSIIALGVIGLWVVVAIAVGKKYDDLIEKKDIVE